MSVESRLLARADVSTLIRFSKHDPGCDKIQSEGVAALCNIMERKGFAYLADEVGMGKTWQAMGTIALTLRQNPAARIVVICPGTDLQRKWQKNWIQFVRDSYLPHDDLIKNRFDGGLALEAILSERLKDFAEHLALNFEQLHLLRYSSFSRPVWIRPKSSLDDVRRRYLKWVRFLGFRSLDSEEVKAFDAIAPETRSRNWREKFSPILNTLYTTRVAQVVSKRPIDLLVFDEAQYLRTDNARNRNLRLIFGVNDAPVKVRKFLFLSATPVHNRKQDLARLKNYLGNEFVFPDQNDATLIESMKQFMVRRVRSYQDQNRNDYSKHMYRNYDSLTIDPRDDAYYSLVLALVQKRLAKVLDGKGNRFRFGECSSFESLKSSTRSCEGYGTADEIRQELEGEEKLGEFELLEGQQHKGKEADSPDRSFLDRLAKSFAALPALKRPLVLPHAKVDESVRHLAERHLFDATMEKGLVFVRRLDTVDELKLRLEDEFQRSIDRRLKDWDAFLERNSLKPLGDFWAEEERAETPEERAETPEEQTEAAEDEDPESSPAATDDSRSGGREINFLTAVKKKRAPEDKNGKLYSFSNRMLRSKDPERKSPLLFLLEENEAVHEAAWLRFLAAIGADPVPVGEDAAAALQRRALKRFLLQTMRRSDFIVDLYVMNEVRGGATLQEVLLRCLEGTFSPGRLLPLTDFPPLREYLHNWRHRLRNCVDLWPVILDNCFPALTEEGMNRQIDAIFYHVTPVASRSGRVQGEQTVNQFKLPGYPNLLICTDVLKEGIDLHLFCDTVYHYGIAWTSGDLEQRIGRVDRFLSKISRSIYAHAGEPSGVPKLKVLFPTLAGTLDQRQVEHVRHRKAVADMLMDFGETLKGDGEYSTGELYDTLTRRAYEARSQANCCVFAAKPHLAKVAQGWQLDEWEQGRDPALSRMASTVLKLLAPEWHPKCGWQYQHSKGPLWQIRYLSQFKALKLTVRQAAGESSPLSLDSRLEWHKINSKWGFYHKRDLLLPVEAADRHAELVSGFAHQGRVTQSFKVTSAPAGFALEPAQAAMVWERSDSLSGRRHRLYLERAGTAYLLRSYVGEDDWGGKSGGRFRFLANLNRHCRIGHFYIDGDRLFYLVFLHDLTMMTDSLLNNVATFSDSIQWWLTAADDDDFHYTTPCSVQGIVAPWERGEMQVWHHILANLLGRSS